MRILAATFVLLLAGCLGQATVQETPDDASTPGRRASLPPQTITPWENQTVFEETIRFPRDASGEQTRSEFVVPAGARSLFLEYRRTLDCPTGTRTDPMFVLKDETAEQREYAVYPNANGGLVPNLVGYYFCIPSTLPPPTTSTSEAMQDSFEPRSGNWTIETFGQCSCSVTIVVRADAPAPS